MSCGNGSQVRRDAMEQSFVPSLSLFSWPETAETSKKPPRKALAIKSAPRIRQIYWCRFPDDAEFWKTRPVVILSKTIKLHGSVIVLLCSSKFQPKNRNAVFIKLPFSEEKPWVICNYVAKYFENSTIGLLLQKSSHETLYPQFPGGNCRTYS